jgi:NitT/TauT family transport system permease protein
VKIPILGKTVPREWAWSRLVDVFVFGLGLALFYGILSIARTWLGPVEATVEIRREPSALPLYTAYSLLRMTLAYLLSLAFTLVYGYIAATNRTAEKLLIPLLDVLQSIPVLSFLPGMLLAMVALFPHSQIGIELGSILLIFTGQVWNMAFSFYSSIKSIPRELYEAARIYRFGWWHRFIRLELPYAMIGLVWNSMMSVAGGWFFLMACEMFVLGQRDFRLPGLGSYLQTAASAGDTKGIAWGLLALVSLIVFLDQLIWRPVISWAEKFKFEQVESAVQERSPVLEFIQGSPAVAYLRRKVFHPVGEWLSNFFARKAPFTATPSRPKPLREWTGRLLGLVLVIAIVYAVVQTGRLLGGLTRSEVGHLLGSAGITFLRVNAALVIGALWTIPFGVWVGLNPRLARIVQPLAQIAASIPATALFPVVLLVLVRLGGGMGIGSILLMLLGTQWYILFNVIAGAMAIPTDMKEAASCFRFRRRERWRLLILPGIFPYLVTGLVTASGGAWNASVVSEYFHFKGEILMTNWGLGASIAHATDQGNFSVLLAATIVMATLVVTINRLVWRRLYHLAEIRFKLDT